CATGHDDHEVHELLRPARSAALLDRARPAGAFGRADPRFPGALRPVLLAEGVSLQQHYPAEPEPPAVARSDGRRPEDRVYRGGGLLPDRIVQARRAAAALGAAR